MAAIVKRRDNMIYRTKVYSVKQDGLEYLADGLIAKGLLGRATDPVTGFPYALLTQEQTGEIEGIDVKQLQQDGDVLGVFKSDFTKEYMATDSFKEDYVETSEVSPIILRQQEITYNREKNIKRASK